MRYRRPSHPEGRGDPCKAASGSNCTPPQRTDSGDILIERVSPRGPRKTRSSSFASTRSSASCTASGWLTETRRPIEASRSKNGRHCSGISASKRINWARVRKRPSGMCCLLPLRRRGSASAWIASSPIRSSSLARLRQSRSGMTAFRIERSESRPCGPSRALSQLRNPCSRDGVNSPSLTSAGKSRKAKSDQQPPVLDTRRLTDGVLTQTDMGVGPVEGVAT